MADIAVYTVTQEDGSYWAEVDGLREAVIEAITLYLAGYLAGNEQEESERPTAPQGRVDEMRVLVSA